MYMLRRFYRFVYQNTCKQNLYRHDKSGKLGELSPLFKQYKVNVTAIPMKSVGMVLISLS